MIEMQADAMALTFAVLADPSKSKELTIEPTAFGAYWPVVELAIKGSKLDPHYDWAALYSDALSKFGTDTSAINAIIEAPTEARKMIGGGKVSSIEKRIRKSRNRQKSIAIIQQMLDGVTSGSDSALNDGLTELMSMNRGDEKHDFSFEEMLDNGLKWIEDKAQGNSHGVSCGFSALNEALGAFHNSDLIVVAARSAMGKTAFLVNLALRCGSQPGIISAEQPNEQMGIRSMVIDSGASMQALRSGRLTDDDLAKVANSLPHLKQIGGRIFDKPNCTILDVQAKAREWKHKHGIAALYVDYLQNIRAADTRKPKHEQVAEVAQGLKDLARELQIPVIVLAQVNRNVESRPADQRRPNMSDIMDSGKIEQEADQIMTLYRDDYYNPESDQAGMVEVDIKKNRHGATGCIKMRWNKEAMQFIDPTEEAAISGWNKESDPLWQH